MPNSFFFLDNHKVDDSIDISLHMLMLIYFQITYSLSVQAYNSSCAKTDSGKFQ